MTEIESHRLSMTKWLGSDIVTHDEFHSASESDLIDVAHICFNFCTAPAFTKL